MRPKATRRLSPALLALLALGSAALGQAAERDEDGQRVEEQLAREDDAPFLTVVLEGLVLEPDGGPAVGAVVVSSAGGKAVTDQDGAYRLVVATPLDAEGVQVTAVGAGGRSLVASTRVGVLSSSMTRVGPLLLSTSTTCQPSWLPTFGEAPGVNGSVLALAGFDDGSGPALFVGGSFSAAGGGLARNMARWDGSSWSAVGNGTNDSVHALAVFDDGSGPALYAAGQFTGVTGVPANRIARWNGSSWSALGSGLNSFVKALAVFDDGNGPALYAGGGFSSAGGVAASRIAKWNGSSWSALGSGLNGNVDALTVFDDGTGPALYGGGVFTSAGGVAANKIARWNGSSWSALGSGMNNSVGALAVFDDGSGSALYATGTFSTAGGVTANRIARWNGSAWSAVGSGALSGTGVLAVFDDGSGPALFTGRTFDSSSGNEAYQMTKWDGSTWTTLAGAGYVFALTVFDAGGPVLCAGGSYSFTTTSGAPALGIAAWDGSSWSAFGNGMVASVWTIATFDDGSGPALYVGGLFAYAGGVQVNRIAKWDGSSWSALGGGLSGYPRALQVFDDGSGPALYVAGDFTTAGGVVANGIAKWGGSTWSALGSGLNGAVFALAVFDDGSGPALHAGAYGYSGNSEYTITRWNGSAWVKVGSGLNAGVLSLTVFDDGGGPALFAGGWFTSVVGGPPVNRVAKWDGTSWSALGSGVGGGLGGASPDVYALTVFDDGSGPALYAGGAFTTAGGGSANRIAKWNGSSWSALGSGMGTLLDYVRALTTYDDGNGPALYAGGLFASAGGVAVNNIARWDGTSWSTLGSGVDDAVFALAVLDDGGPALFAGGKFFSAFDSSDSFLAEWGCDTTPPTLTCPPTLSVAAPFPAAAGESFSRLGIPVTFEVTASDAHDASPTVVCVPPSGSLFPRGTTMVTCTATDDSGNQSTCSFPVTVQLRARWR